MYRKLDPLRPALRWALPLLAAAMVYLSVQLLQLALLHSRLDPLMEAIRLERSSDVERLLKGIREMEREGMLAGVHSDFHARAAATIFVMSRPVSPITKEEMLEFTQKALEYRPRDGFMWAQLALHSIPLRGQSEQAWLALEHAIEFGKNDYNTLKILSHIAIRDWPKFDCRRKLAMYRVLNRARMKNDLILNRWSRENRDMRLEQYIEHVSRQYGFSMRWAEVEVRKCMNGEL